MEDTSKQEILVAIATLSDKVDGHDQKFELLGEKIDGVKSDLTERIDGVRADLTQQIENVAEAVQTLGQHMDDRFEVVDARLTGIESRTRRVETTMVTKHDLDDRLDNFRGDLVGFIRGEDKKMLAKLK